MPPCPQWRSNSASLTIAGLPNVTQTSADRARHGAIALGACRGSRVSQSRKLQFAADRGGPRGWNPWHPKWGPSALQIEIEISLNVGGHRMEGDGTEILIEP